MSGSKERRHEVTCCDVNMFHQGDTLLYLNKKNQPNQASSSDIMRTFEMRSWSY